MAQMEQEKDAHLFSLRPTYRFNTKEGIHTAGVDLARGQNPPQGAIVDYYLADSSEAAVEFSVMDMEGNVVRKIEGKQSAGLHRMNWDLRYERPLQPKLRTTPEGKPWVADEFNEEGWRILYTWDLDLNAGNKRGPRVTPGTYKVSMKVGNQEQSQYLEVRKDPDSEGTINDIREQTQFALQLYNSLNLTVEMINESEWIRKQLQDQMADMKPRAKQEAAALLETLDEIASRLYDTNLTGAREDAFRNPMKLYGRLSAVLSDVNGSGIDFPPTDQQVEVYEVLKGRLDKVEEDYEEGMKTLQALNEKHGLDIGKKVATP